MRRLLLAVAACTIGSAAKAGVVVVANFTPEAVTLTLTEPGREKQSVTLQPAQVAPVGVGGPPTNPLEYEGRAANAELGEWLRDRGALTPAGALPLTGFIVRWGAMDAVPASTTTWVNGRVDWYQGASTTVIDAGA